MSLSLFIRFEKERSCCSPSPRDVVSAGSVCISYISHCFNFLPSLYHRCGACCLETNFKRVEKVHEKSVGNVEKFYSHFPRHACATWRCGVCRTSAHSDSLNEPALILICVILPRFCLCVTLIFLRSLELHFRYLTCLKTKAACHLYMFFLVTLNFIISFRQLKILKRTIPG